MIFLAGYRPKSLEDINQSYDSEMSVTRAIKRETSKVTQNAPNVADVFSKANQVSEKKETTDKIETSKQVEDFSDAVEDFIKQISSRPAGTTKIKPQIPYEPTPVFEEPKKSVQITEPAPAPVPTPAPTAQPAEPATRQVSIPDPTVTRADEDFSTLIDDYEKVFGNYDEETSEKKSFFWKRGKKKSDTSEDSEFVEDTTEPENDEAEDTTDEVEAEPEEKLDIPSEDNIKDVFVNLFEELEDSAESTEEPQESEAEETEPQVPEVKSEQTFEEAAQNEAAAEPETQEDGEDSFSFDELIEEDIEEAPEQEQHEEQPKKKKGRKASKREKANKEEENISQAADEDSDYDWDDDSEEDNIAYKPKTAHNGARVFFRVVLSIVLAISLLSTFAVGSLGILFHVNEGVSAPGGLYLFTASRDFEQTDIKSGDLVVCNARNSADDGQAVVYVDRQNKIFSFGIKNGSITGTDGEIYYAIGDNTVMRDNVLGTVGQTIPTVGRIINLVYSQYFIILAALLVVCIALFLIVTIALRNKAKMISKYTEEDFYFESEEDDEDKEAEEAVN